MHTVVPTPDFDSQAASLQLGEAILDRVADDVSKRPTAGMDLFGIPGLKSRTLDPVVTGAESAVEVVSYYAGEDVPVFLIDMAYAGETLRLTAPEKVELAMTLAGIAAEYRANEQKKILAFRQGRDE